MCSWRAPANAGRTPSLQPHLAQDRLCELLVLPAVAADAAELDAVEREPRYLLSA
jgi:hypothetical protein